MWYVICLVIGLVVGTCFGVILASIIHTGSQADNWKDEKWGE